MWPAAPVSDRAPCSDKPYATSTASPPSVSFRVAPLFVFFSPCQFGEPGHQHSMTSIGDVDHNNRTRAHSSPVGLAETHPEAPSLLDRNTRRIAIQQVSLASSILLEYAPGLRPRTNTPGTQRARKTYAPPRLVNLRFRQKRRSHWLCISPYLSPANRLATLPACGLDHIRRRPTGSKRPSALLLLLKARV